MDAALNWLWQGCVVALATSAMLRLLQRARANVRYVVCWAALLLILVLPVLGTPVPRADALGAVAGDAIVSMPDDWWTSGAAMLAAWTAWASVSILRFVWAMIALRRARTCSHPFPPQVESLLRHWRCVRLEGRRARLGLSDSVPMAAVLGCGAPVIAVAPALMTRLDADELDRIVIHEWAHVQRRDDLLTAVQIVIRCVAGWHPAVWWLERRLHLEREVACDEMTVALTGSPKLYAECLVKLASLRRAAVTALAAPAVLTASGLRDRIARIVSRDAFTAPFWSRGIAIAIVSALCATSLVVGGLRLVEVTAFALPFESIRMAGVSVPRIAPLAVPNLASQAASPRVRRQSVAAGESTRRPRVPSPAPAASATSPPEPQIAPEDPAAIDSTVPHALVEASAILDASAGAPAAPDPTVDGDRSPWAKVADGGTALGRKSKDAGVATAGFFSRFARRVATAF